MLLNHTFALSNTRENAHISTSDNKTIFKTMRMDVEWLRARRADVEDGQHTVLIWLYLEMHDSVCLPISFTKYRSNCNVNFRYQLAFQIKNTLEYVQLFMNIYFINSTN